MKFGVDATEAARRRSAEECWRPPGSRRRATLVAGSEDPERCGATSTRGSSTRRSSWARPKIEDPRDLRGRRPLVLNVADAEGLSRNLLLARAPRPAVHRRLRATAAEARSVDRRIDDHARRTQGRFIPRSSIYSMSVVTRSTSRRASSIARTSFRRQGHRPSAEPPGRGLLPERQAVLAALLARSSGERRGAPPQGRRPDPARAPAFVRVLPAFNQWRVRRKLARS